MTIDKKAVSKLIASSLLVLAICACNKGGSGGSASETTIACANSLNLVAQAKKVWAAKSGADSNATPTWDDLSGSFRHGPPSCPEGGTYTIGSMSELPKCSIAAHNQYFQSHQEPTK